jgi:hypothetical protein
MKITLKQLKSLIREMAFGGVVGNIVNTTPRDKSGRRFRDYKGHFRPLKKYHSSKLYKKNAEYIFKNFYSNIWIVPTFNRKDRYPVRVKTLSLQEAESTLLQSGIGLKPEDIENGMTPSSRNENYRLENIKNHLDSGGCIIISNSESLEKNFWPSPWMILHAIIDDFFTLSNVAYANDFHYNIIIGVVGDLKSWEEKTSDLLTLYISNPDYFQNGVNKFFPAWEEDDNSEFKLKAFYKAFCLARRSLMTMGSARKNAINPRSLLDLFAESIVQSMTHSNQFHFLSNNTNKKNIIANALQEYGFIPDESLIKTIIHFLESYELEINRKRSTMLDNINNLMKGSIVFISVADLKYGQYSSNYRKENS